MNAEWRAARDDLDAAKGNIAWYVAACFRIGDGAFTEADVAYLRDQSADLDAALDAMDAATPSEAAS